MPHYLCDLHLHSKYSRATSKESDLEHFYQWAQFKGLDIIGTGDFTYPVWFKELQQRLEETEPGLYQLKNQLGKNSHPVRFMLTTELACIYSQGGKVRRLHLCVFAPSLAAATKLNDVLTNRGFNLRADGRPILGISAHDLLALLLETDPGFELVPAHAWTPWFAVFGSKSGFDSLEECFGDLTNHIHAIETGLSSDPAMNWRLSALDKVMLVSNSDAHSPPKLGREANIFDLDQLSYGNIINIWRTKNYQKFFLTMEFFPEEGMYHWDGHRLCGVSGDPAQTKKWNDICPQCHKPLTIGVLNRVDNLADREQNFKPKNFVSYKSLVPLPEIIAEVYKTGVNSKLVQEKYFYIVKNIMPELPLLLNSDEQAMKKINDPLIIEGIKRVQEGRLNIQPGFDGQYGKIEIFSEQERKKVAQQSLF